MPAIGIMQGGWQFDWQLRLLIGGPFPYHHLFEQGHVYRSSTGKLERWFKPDWISLDNIPTTPVDYPLLKVRGGGVARGSAGCCWDAGRAAQRQPLRICKWV